LVSLLRQEYGEDFHPIMKMAKHAVEMDKQADQGDISRTEAVNAWDKIAQYTEPKLKAMEITAEVSQVDTDEARREVEQLLSGRTGSDT
jgi:hypothetical protein